MVEHTFGPKGFIRNIAKPLWNLPTHYLHLLQLKKRKSTCSILKTIIYMNEPQTHQNHHQVCPNTQRHTYNYQLKCCSKHLTTPIQCKPTTNNHNKYTGKTKQKLQRKKKPSNWDCIRHHDWLCWGEKLPRDTYQNRNCQEMYDNS